MRHMPPTSGGQKMEIDDDVFFQVKKEIYYGTIIKIFKDCARVRLFNSERRFLVRLEALKKMVPDDLREEHPQKDHTPPESDPSNKDMEATSRAV
jgi:hypothetical protein